MVSEEVRFDIALLQRRDEWISSLRERLNTDLDVRKQYVDLDGRLYHKIETDDEIRFRLCVPRSIRKELMAAHHSHLIAGHLGLTKTLEKIKRKYFWPHLRKDVVSHVQSCNDCQTKKSLQRRPPGLMQPIKPSLPFYQVGIDILGRFPKSKHGNRNIIVCTDYGTRWVEAAAVPDATAYTVAEFFLKNIVLKHGSPTKVISDRGSCFISEVFRQLLQMIQTEHNRTTAYHPECNGLTERFNKTCGISFDVYLHKSQKLVKPNLPSDVILKTNDNYITKRKNYIQLMPREALVYIQKAQTNNKRNYDKRHRPTTYKIGDLVSVKCPIWKKGLSKKLLHNYYGPN
ncbi:integrase core domain protein-like protein [Leptotrombidium deliense]|uniref:RNA-directed DNA polymerase n=1 Tax=Leptotrombidium deliense TaxID=299467 RepID=A0A443RYZ3_9ACAR|nr:integrase core domain protein-like protein [Leptotrombidium deliense]